MIDFIGIGAQKSGTSWVYACLYEHPEICAPVKEIHFFSRPRYEKGRAWYEHHWRACDTQLVKGEYSTSYLYGEQAASRIYDLYPDVKLIAILRNPHERAYSQYRNAIKAGEITDTMAYETYAQSEPSCLEQGYYWKQLERYRSYFDDEQLLVLVYEDIAKDPLAFIQRIYRHLGVADDFVPPSLTSRINVARTPKDPRVDTLMHKIAESLRLLGFDRLVHAVKRSGIPDWLRSFNTKSEPERMTTPRLAEAEYLEDGVALGTYLKRDLVSEWQL